MFSVVIPYFKKRDYIERCLDAVLNQSFTDFEIIVVDDGSQDDIAHLISSKYAAKVTLVQQPNQGVSAARNAGIANAKNEYIAFLDADDVWQYDYLKIVNKVIKDLDSDLIAVGYTNNIEELQKGQQKLGYRIMTEDEYLLESCYSGIITSSSVVVKKILFNVSNNFDVTLKKGEDIEMWLRLVKNANCFIVVKNILTYYDVNIVGQATNVKFDFKYSFASRLEDLSIGGEKYYLFAKRFMYCRLFEYNFSNPEKTLYFIDLFKLNKSLFSFYKIDSKCFEVLRNSKMRVLVNKYLKITVRFIK
jgi:glycosyltransferase involved in cell wall biosynthesis